MNSRHHPITIDDIRGPIADDLLAVDQVIRKRLASEVVLINQISNYIIESGGKRLRPALVVIAGNHFLAPRAHVHELAAVIEFIHTATLLHDDVVDESTLRRVLRPPMRNLAMPQVFWSVISSIRAHFK